MSTDIMTDVMAVGGRGDAGDSLKFMTNATPSTLRTTDFSFTTTPRGYIVLGYQPMPGSLFHLACSFFFLAFMGGGQTDIAAIYTNVLCACAFLSLAVWAGIDACSLDVIIWSLVLVAINISQVIYISYKSKKMEEAFDNKMQIIYHRRFAPFQIRPHLFYDLITLKGCQILKLGKGQKYAAEGKTPIENLSLLLSGKIKVSSEGKFLHYITPNEFVDSPEWDSLKSTSARATYQVSIVADTECLYITWKRKPLLNLLSKRQRLGKLMRFMIGRDVVMKLFALNSRQFNERGFYYDIRLPCVMSLRDEVQRRERKRQENASEPATPSLSARRHRKLGKKASEHYARLFARRMSERINLRKEGKVPLRKEIPIKED
ncbi:unnamed protein product [Clavelina lepadiformis]|uniref:POPDC1-3 domain-containing protein n=1 Tax=Clavelina lepadiformis TaxID=159417 RepID=A0ABP0G529_CLALP